ncbi:MAG: S-layer homology domain-containing protein, partial [Oscillospiraceae bacterium]|nr:S-layer homology domain-containing protein [Oscillospiraceae bacterium]
NDPATRADLVYSLWRLSGAPAPASKAGFGDLNEDWYIDAVSWAAANGIVNGYSATVFGPDNNVTREQIVTVMYRYAAWLGQDTRASKDLSAYSDAGSVSSWARTAMSWANARGLITGMTDTTLVPTGTATRAQVAAILERF